MRISDWSSDVCSSDLTSRHSQGTGLQQLFTSPYEDRLQSQQLGPRPLPSREWRCRCFCFLNVLRKSSLKSTREARRSEERRVGKSVSVRVDLGGRRIIKKTNTQSDH